LKEHQEKSSNHKINPLFSLLFQSKFHENKTKLMVTHMSIKIRIPKLEFLIASNIHWQSISVYDMKITSLT